MSRRVLAERLLGQAGQLQRLTDVAFRHAADAKRSGDGWSTEGAGSRLDDDFCCLEQMIDRHASASDRRDVDEAARG
jgi:hypothetical protein